MKIVGFRGRKKGQMVAGMSVKSRKYGQWEPQIRSCNVGTNDEDTQKWWNKIGAYMLNRIAINRCHRDRGRPLVMLFMNVFVQISTVQ